MDLNEILNLEVDLTTLGLNFEQLSYIEYENSRIPDYDPHIDTKAEIFWQEELTNQELVSPLFKINRNEK